MSISSTCSKSTSATQTSSSTKSGSASKSSSATQTSTANKNSSSSATQTSSASNKVGTDTKTASSTAEKCDCSSTGTSVKDTVDVSKKECKPRDSVNNLLGGIENWAKEENQESVDNKAEAQDAADKKNAQVDGRSEKTDNPANDPSADGATANGDATNPDAAANTEQTTPALELAQGELLSRSGDANPEKVTQLQEMLKGQGMDLAVDGKFGPETQNAVRQYQQRNNLKVDGIVGPETMGSLNGNRGGQPGDTANSEAPAGNNGAAAANDPTNPATPGEQGQLRPADPNMSPQEQYDYYKGIVEANGGRMNADGPTVLGMRGLGVDGSYHDSAQNTGGYNDTFVVLDRGADGNPIVRSFQGATHANQTSSGASYGPDASGRNIRGVAQLQPGSYDVDFATSNYGGYGNAYHVKTLNGNGLVPAFRDTNADGVISASERNAAISGGYQASAILFHNGKGSRPSSIGCQTIIPSQHSAFSQMLGRNGFSYTLVDANNAYMPAE